MYAGEIVLDDNHFVRVDDWILVDGEARTGYYGSVSAIKDEFLIRYDRKVNEIRWCNTKQRFANRSRRKHV